MNRGGPDYENPLWHCVGRSDVFARQNQDGSYTPVRRPISSEDIAEHEAGLWSIGTYTTDNDRVNFIVFDLDTMDPYELTVLKAAVEYAVDPLADPGAYECLLLEESGGKGYHAWLFLDEWTAAARVRAWLEQRFWPNYERDSTIGRKLEVFPKQDHVPDGRFGNLVKLPLGKHARSGNRSKFVPCQGWANAVSNVRGMDTTSFPTVTNQPAPATQASTAATGVLTGNGPVARFIKGEVQQGERNACFHAFFSWCAWNIHLPDHLAWQWWQELNEELPEPEDNEAEVEQTMRSAYDSPPPEDRSPRRGSASAPAVGINRQNREERVNALRKEGHEHS